MNTISFDNSFARLPDAFFVRLDPTPVKQPGLIRINHELADLLGIDPDFLTSPEGIAVLSGNSVPQGAEPLAMAYAGHQFGNFVPELGDGRANLLGEVIGRDGIRRDIQLKGAGPTPFSRMGDGRAALGPVLREYIVSEAMAALGVPTTRALAALSTGEPVYREAVLPGAILTRVAQSHIRVGTFQYFAARQDRQALELLVDHVNTGLYPQAANTENPALALLDQVVAKQARLIAWWMSLGFIHGVMNTDNMSIAGETIDFGPCAFMDDYHPRTVFSYVDQNGRYAFQNQPAIGQWNLSRLAQSLLPLIDDNEEKALEAAQASIERYPLLVQTAFNDISCAKIGQTGQTSVSDIEDKGTSLITDLLLIMARNRADFTLTFRSMARGDDTRTLFQNPAAFDEWETVWHQRLKEEGRSLAEAQDLMMVTNPAIIPRNHLVEEAIRAGEDNNDFSVFETLADALARPFDPDLDGTHYSKPPTTDKIVKQTFCGT